jgi:hypothetical protein
MLRLLPGNRIPSLGLWARSLMMVVQALSAPANENPASPGTWTVHWSHYQYGSNDGYCDVQHYIAQDEVDARTKYYSLATDAAVILVVNQSAILHTPTGAHDFGVSFCFGDAVQLGALTIPRATSNYVVISQLAAPQYTSYQIFRTNDGVAAGVHYQQRDSANAAASIINQDGSISKVNRVSTDWARLVMFGYYFADVNSSGFAADNYFADVNQSGIRM